MSCGCKGPSEIQSWNDFNNTPPQDPLDLIALATLNAGGSTVGTWTLVTNYARPAGSSVWIASPFTIAGEVTVATNGTDQVQNISDASQWNFDHTTSNVASTLAPPLRKLVFMKAGTQWSNNLPLVLGAGTYTELQLSFLDNAATRGDAQGTIPVIRWAGSFTGVVTIDLVLKKSGRFTLGLLGVDNAGTPNYSMFEIDIVAEN